MDKFELIEKAKGRIGASDLGGALDLVKNHLQTDRKYRRLYDESVRLLGAFNKTIKDDTGGLISFDNARVNYNQVTDGLLQLLRYIEEGDLNPAALQAPPTPVQSYYQSHKWQVLLALPSLLIAIVVLVWVLQNDGTNAPIENDEITVADCPFDEARDFNIMLLHFYLPAGADLKPEGLIAEKLESFCAQNKIGARVEILKKPEKPDRLVDYSVANDLGKLCLARMVIWGRAEKNGTKTEVKTRYRYLGKQGDIAFSQIKWQGENQIGAEQTLSSLVTQGELFEDVEKVILLVQGIIASDANQPQLALDNLEKLDTKDSTALLMKGMVQAENHLKQGDDKKALNAYDKVLETHPNYWLALNNRGVLEMQAGENLQAIEDLSVALTKRPDDPNMLLALGKAYENSEQLLPAKAAYEKVIALKSDNAPQAIRLLEATKIKIIKNEDAIRRIERKDVSRRTIRDTIALLDANRNLGQNDRTTSLLTNIKLIRPSDPALVAREVETLLRQRNEEAAKKVMADAIKKGMKKEDIANNCRDISVKKFVLKGI